MPRKCQIKTCFSQKPLGHFQPNFVCKLLSTSKMECINILLVTVPRLSLCAYIVKPFKNLFPRNQQTDFRKNWYVHVVSGNPALHSLFKLWSLVDVDLFYGKVISFSSRKHFHTKVIPDLHLTYSKTGEILGLAVLEIVKTLSVALEVSLSIMYVSREATFALVQVWAFQKNE